MPGKWITSPKLLISMVLICRNKRYIVLKAHFWFTVNKYATFPFARIAGHFYIKWVNSNPSSFHRALTKDRWGNSWICIKITQYPLHSKLLNEQLYYLFSSRLDRCLFTSSQIFQNLAQIPWQNSRSSLFRLQYLQAMYNCASLSPVVFLLPLIHLTDELQEGAFRNGSVPVHGPSQELELLHHPIAVLGL